MKANLWKNIFFLFLLECRLQIESGKRIAQLEIELSEAEKQRTVPLKVALVFFFTWILISAAVVRLWETNWSYFTAYYYFFTSLTTIGNFFLFCSVYYAPLFRKGSFWERSRLALYIQFLFIKARGRMIFIFAVKNKKA